MVEDSLQYKYLRRLELGQRLFRDVDLGHKYEEPKEDKLQWVPSTRIGNRSSSVLM